MSLSLPAWLSLTARTLLVLLLSTSLLFAADTAKVKNLLGQSGFTEQVQSWSGMVRAEIRQHGEITDDNLDTESLDRYQDFLASEPAQRFHQAIHEGMTSALSREIDSWANQLH